MSANLALSTAATYITQVFESDQFGRIRVIVMNNILWFVAKDVCVALGIKNVSDTLNRLKDYEKNTIVLNEGIRGNPTTLVISESGLYKLIGTSRKPQAEPFQDWVFEEVVPSIRKTGSYSIPPDLQPTGIEQFSNEQIVARAWIIVNEQLETAKKRIAELEPQARIGDAVTASVNSSAIGDLAKILLNYDIKWVYVGGKKVSMGRNNLFKCLLEMHHIMEEHDKWGKYYMPTQRYMNMGIYDIEYSQFFIQGELINRPTVKVTGKGIGYYVNFFSDNQLMLSLPFTGEVLTVKDPDLALQE